MPEKNPLHLFLLTLFLFAVLSFTIEIYLCKITLVSIIISLYSIIRDETFKYVFIYIFSK